MSKNHNEVAVVTGSSTGIGFETSLALARKGYITCATMRNIQKAKLLESIARKENDQSVLTELIKPVGRMHGRDFYSRTTTDLFRLSRQSYKEWKNKLNR